MENRRFEEFGGGNAEVIGKGVGEGSKELQGKERSGEGRLPPEVPLDLTKETRGENRGVSGEGGTEWHMAATSVHDDVLLDSEDCYK